MRPWMIPPGPPDVVTSLPQLEVDGSPKVSRAKPICGPTSKQAVPFHQSNKRFKHPYNIFPQMPLLTNEDKT
jgi:hypothetical protein